MTRKLQWVPDLPDFRDHIYAATITTLPAKTDLRSFCSAVEDQGNLGSCTGNAIAGALEAVENIKKATFVDISRLFIYYNERLIEHTTRQDSGAYIRDGIKSVASTGAAAESIWPYNIAKFKRKPIKAAYKDALTRKITEYQRVTSFADLKAALAEGFPVVFGFTVYDSFMSQKVADTGMVPMPAKNEQVAGGHAVLCVGYDDATQHVIVRNSWGPDWGDKGYFYMPYAYISDANLCDDFWVVKA